MRILDVNKDTIDELLSRLLKRSPTNYTQYESVVADVIENVRANGDEAVFAYTKQFDGATITEETIAVTDAEIEEAYQEVSPELLDVIRKALVNIRDYHAKQLQNSWFDSKDGIILGQSILSVLIKINF